MVTSGKQETGSRLRTNRVGLWLFFLSESFLFSALLFTRFFLQGVNRPSDLNQPLGFAISAILLLSSLTAYRAEAAVAHGEEGTFRRSIFLTAALGMLFLAGVGLEWSEGFRHFPPSTGFGTVFFTLTGFHALHVVTGIVLLAFLVLPGQRGRFTPDNYFGVEGIVKYWHFVDVVWLFIFPALYLVS
jgi:cytochrome c oxidase subunit 3